MSQEQEIKKVETIPNWGMFEVLQAQIHLVKYYDEENDDEEMYNASLFLFVDTGQIDDANVTLFTDLSHSDPVQCAKITFIYASTLFNNISPIAVILPDEDAGEEAGETIDLRQHKITPTGYSIH